MLEGPFSLARIWHVRCSFRGMSQIIAPSEEYLDHEVARLRAARTRRVAVILSSIVAVAAVFVAISYLSLTDTSPDAKGAPAPISAHDMLAITE